MEWLVRLEGDNWSLEHLPEWFGQLDHKVRPEDDKYYLTSLAFEHCATSTEVIELAEQIVEWINGAVKAFEPRFHPVQVGSEIVELDDVGARRVHQHLRILAPGESRGKGRPVTVLIDGEPLPPQPSEAEKLVAKWEQCEAKDPQSNLGRVLRIGLLPQQTWGPLYHVYEAIKDDMSGGKGGSDEWKALLPLLPNLSEAQAKRELDRFRDTANDPKHAGPHARHGRPEPKPTPDAMSLQDAQLLIRQLVGAWLLRKT
jgi:hypothetical protein